MADYWEVHFEILDNDGNSLSVGQLAKAYKRKGYAERAGKEFCNGLCNSAVARIHYWLVGREFRRYNNG